MRWPGKFPADPADADTLQGCTDVLAAEIGAAFSPILAKIALAMIARFPAEFMAVAELAPRPAPPKATLPPSDDPQRGRREILRPRYGAGQGG